MRLLVGLAQLVVGHKALGVDHQLVAEQGGPAQLAHHRIGKFVEGVRQDDDLEAAAQVIEKILGADHRRHAADHRLDVGQLQAMLPEQPQPVTHQLVVVGLVAGGALEFGNAGALGERYPDFRDQHAFKIEANNLHGRGAPVGGRGGGRRGPQGQGQTALAQPLPTQSTWASGRAGVAASKRAR